MTLIIIVFWKMKPKNLLDDTMSFLGIKLADPKRFERLRRVSKTPMLPLHQGSIKMVWQRDR